MILTAAVHGEQLLPDFGLHLRRGEVPGADLLMFPQQLEEFRELNATVSGAGADTEHGVEGLRVAGVRHGDQALLTAADGLELWLRGRRSAGVITAGESSAPPGPG